MSRRGAASPESLVSLHHEFNRISRDHSSLVAQHASQVVLGASVMRVFVPQTKKDLLPFLPALPLLELEEINNQEGFEKWFTLQLNRLARRILLKNKDNPRVNPGYKWGHGTKILSLYLREVVLNSRYFNDRTTRKISPFLYVPIDSKIMDKMRKLGFKLPFNKIKDIHTKQQFMQIQQILGDAAAKVQVPRIWFDYIWGEIK